MDSMMLNVWKLLHSLQSQTSVGFFVKSSHEAIETCAIACKLSVKTSLVKQTGILEGAQNNVDC